MEVKQIIESHLFTGWKDIALVRGLRPRFNVRENFSIESSSENGLRIASLNDNFQNWFLRDDEELFFSSTDSVLTVRSLLPAVTEKAEVPIFEILAYFGVRRSLVSLQEIYRLMTQHNSEPNSKLLSNGHGNIFFVAQKISSIYLNYFTYHDVQGREVEGEVDNPDLLFVRGQTPYILRMLYLCRSPGKELCWNVASYPVDIPEAFLGARQIFAHNSVLDCKISHETRDVARELVS